jgi:acetyl-CoA acetyltransferase
VIGEELGFCGMSATTVQNGCATGSVLLDIGRAMILGGQHDIVLCVAASRSPEGFFPSVGQMFDTNDFDFLRYRIMGKTNPSMFAYQAVRRMHNFGMTPDDMAQVKVKNSKHGARNPLARYQREYTIEEVQASPMVAWPAHLLEFCTTSDGACAIILASMEKARQLTAKPVILAAVNCPQPTYPSQDIGLAFFSTHSTISSQPSIPDVERPHECEVTRGALEIAGIGPEDLDLAEVYDICTAMEFDWIEDIGICAPGEAEKLLWDGDTAIGGRIPVNPSGGTASFGEAYPAQALVQVYELVQQLRGNAGPRQIEGATVGLAANKGLGQYISTVIVKR